MNTKSLFLALALAICTSFAASAQITTGEPTAKVIRTGNRAKAGNFGLYIGATSTMFSNMIDSNVDIVPLPLLNLKYMTSDNFELRVGLEAYKLSENISGTVDTDPGINEIKEKYGESTVMLYPGFAYHFSRLNILDVYIGAELPLGWNTNIDKRIETEYTRIVGFYTPVKTYSKERKAEFKMRKWLDTDYMPVFDTKDLKVE